MTVVFAELVTLIDPLVDPPAAALQLFCETDKTGFGTPWVTEMVLGEPETPDGDVAVTVTVADRDEPELLFEAVMVKLPGVEPPDAEVVSQAALSETVYVIAPPVPEFVTLMEPLVPPAGGAVHPDWLHSRIYVNVTMGSTFRFDSPVTRSFAAKYSVLVEL